MWPAWCNTSHLPPSNARTASVSSQCRPWCRGVPMSDVVAAAGHRIDELDLPVGINITLSGTYEGSARLFRRPAHTLAALIIVLVYIVMAARFESYTYPGIIMTSLLFAFSGVFIILWLTGHTLNIMSMIGAIMLIGIVVKNGIVLIDYISLNRERGLSIRRSVVDGGMSRLRPVLMTTHNHSRHGADGRGHRTGCRAVAPHGCGRDRRSHILDPAHSPARSVALLSICICRCSP